MAIADLKNVLNIFGGSDVSEAQQKALFEEVLLMTLARAADADINIQRAEVERIQGILKDHTGKEFSAADVRVAARAELYAEANLRKYLSKVARKMRPEHRAETVQALGEVFRSDEDVSVLEVDFFNRTVEAMGATPAEIAGLVPGAVDGEG
ncbi:MAG: TerB family tellurite resistance protein [Woeseiaceae bacterium]